MYRKAEEFLHQWFKKYERKPLVIRGARQVGKSYLVHHFVQSSSLKLLALNFDQSPELASLFTSRQPTKILSLLEVHFNAVIDPHQALLFLDEIQAAPEVLSVIRYFYEQLPELPVIAAGSLLDFVLADHDFAMPVGRIEYLHLEPMSFTEFLLAQNKNKLLQYMTEFNFTEPMPDLIHQELINQLKAYTIVGGMPEVVQCFVNTGSFEKCNAIQDSILATFRDDFTKYKKSGNTDLLRKVFQKIPTMVGEKFMYSKVDRDIRSHEIRKALDALIMAKVATPIYHSDGNGVPLGAQVHEKDYKVIFLDVGLLSKSLGLSILDVESLADLCLVHAGAVAEQLVGQLLKNNRPFYEEPALYCWIRQKKQSSAEIDYLIAVGQQIYPVEVKAGKTGTLKSLHYFLREKNYTTGIRFNSAPPTIFADKTSLAENNGDFRLISLPFYFAEQVKSIVTKL